MPRMLVYSVEDRYPGQETEDHALETQLESTKDQGGQGTVRSLFTLDTPSG